MLTSDRPPTIRDVAALAGVAPKTVSRVINGEPHVSADKRALVAEAIETLRFRPDAGARELAHSPRRRSGPSQDRGTGDRDPSAPPSTVQQVAEVAGVAPKTVSRVINNEAHVAPRTRQKVLEAAELLRYVPHAGAQSLRSRSRPSHHDGLTAPCDPDP